MPSKSSLLLVALLTVLHFGPAVQGAQRTPPSGPAPASPPTADVVPRIEAEANAHKAELVAIKEYHSSLLDTVYWALGTLATVAALLAGFGWFANFKLYDADKARLKEEFARMLAEASAKTDARVATAETDLLVKVDIRLDSAAQRLSGDLQGIRSDLAALAKAQADGSAAASETSARLSALLAKNSKSLRLVEANMRQVEEYVWELKKIPTNKLVTQGQGLAAAIEAGEPYYVSSALDRMRETITNEILQAGHTLEESILKLIQSRVADAAKIDPIRAGKVSELVKAIPEREKPVAKPPT